MSEHPLDRIFRERLAQQEAGPVDHLWAGIAGKQRALRRRRRLKYVAGLLAALCLLVAGYLMLQGLITEDSPIIKPEPEPISTNPDFEGPMANATERTDYSIFEAEEISEAASLINESAENGLVAAVIEPLQRNEATALRPNVIPNDPTPNTLATPPTAEDNLSELAAAAVALDHQINENRFTPRFAHPMLLSEASMQESVESSGSVLIVETPALSLGGQMAAFHLDGEFVSSIEKPAIEPTRPKARFELEATLGPAYAYQILKTASEAFRPQLDAREVSEFPALSYGGGIRLRYRFPSGISLRGGLSYSAIRNQLEYEMPIPGTDPELIERINSLRLLELPLMLGYELPGRRVKLGLSAGPVFNLVTTAQGRYLSAESQMPVDFAEDNTYRSTAGVGWRFNLSTSYQLGQGGTRLLIEPTFSHYPRSFTTDANPVSERYWTVGLQVGIRKRL